MIDPRTTGCHLVQIGYEPESRNPVAKCETLPAELCVEIAAKAPEWRDIKYQVRDWWTIIRRESLPGIAVIRETKRKAILRLFDPITVAFEPTALNERDPALSQIAMAGDGRPTAAEPTSKPMASWKRSLLIAGIPGVLSIALCAGLVLDAIDFGVKSHQFLMRLGLLVALQFCIATVAPFRADEWWIVPGAVVTRQTILKLRTGKPQRFTPADSILFLREIPRGWQAEFWHDDKVHVRRLTSLETSALLAAWRSPLPPPTLDQLREIL